MNYQMKYHMANRIRNWVLVVTMLVIAGVAVGQEGIPPVPSPPRLVNDLTGTTLTGGEINALEQKLLNYEDTTSTQIAILIVATVQPYDIADFGQRTAQSWGIGGQEDNGVLIVVATEDRQIHIATGYGMEGVVPDAAAYTIITDYIQPNFRAGNFLGGLDEATSAIMGLASGEYTAEELAGDDNSMSWLPVVLFIIIFFVIPMIASKNRRRRAVGSRDIPWWIFLGGPGGGSSRNGWNDFSRGGGDFGGFGGGGGGGFGGFGGGGFGGGGASGGW